LFLPHYQSLAAVRLERRSNSSKTPRRFRQSHRDRTTRTRSRRLGTAWAIDVAGAAFGIASAVQASIPGSDGVIHGCYGKPGTPQKGELRVINADQGEGCRFYENPVVWNARGVTGATGPTGPTGPTGLTGLAMVLGTSKSIGGNTAGFNQANCPAGKIAITGGSVTDFAEAVSHLETIGSYNLGFLNNGTTPNGSWVVEVQNTGATAQSFQAEATCVDAAVLGLGPVKLIPKPASKGARPAS
jgi:hypothetical protein